MYNIQIIDLLSYETWVHVEDSDPTQTPYSLIKVYLGDQRLAIITKTRLYNFDPLNPTFI